MIDLFSDLPPVDVGLRAVTISFPPWWEKGITAHPVGSAELRAAYDGLSERWKAVAPAPPSPVDTGAVWLTEFPEMQFLVPRHEIDLIDKLVRKYWVSARVVYNHFKL